MASKNPYNHIYADWDKFARYINIEIAKDYLFQLENGNILCVNLHLTDTLPKYGQLFLEFSSYFKYESKIHIICKLTNDTRRNIIKRLKHILYISKYIMPIQE
jgi:hypothetical protein